MPKLKPNAPTKAQRKRARAELLKFDEGSLHSGSKKGPKTQASLPSQDAVLLLPFGLLRAGHIRVRKIDGWQEMLQVAAASVAA